ncbi:hypothetical protein F511_43406 [Dorcoceras hygrometricum]|uniref:Uncharacterized protein n=1 Tax=Dorcoceras hygrometricum TaxID=472368 RepID=A0A2Z7CC79_9LAMI|nr:hypothetical protein F511_43406 [Dorcoceras hygrometricum]
MTSSQSAVSYSDQQLSKSYQQMSREAQEMKRVQLLRKQALKQRESWISDDDISSDVITINRREEIEIISTVDESVDSRYSRRQLMSKVEQEADNSKRNSEENDVVLKNQQMVRVQQMATVEWIHQKRKDKDSADALCIDNQQSQDTSRQLQYIQTRASAFYLISRGCIANDVV